MCHRPHCALVLTVFVACSVGNSPWASACPEEPGSRCGASSEREAWVQKRFEAEAGTDATGARVSITRLRGSDSDDTGRAMSVSFSGHSERYAAYKSFSVREASFAFLGGGSLGLEGGIGMDVAAGVRLLTDRNQGAVLRLGMRGYLLGNDKLYESLLEIPQLQLGYQFLRPKEVLEISGRIGPVLAGRFNTGDEAERKLGRSVEVGGHAAVHFDPIHLEIQHSHVLLDGPLGDVDLFSSRFCGDAWPLQLCVDARVGNGQAIHRGGGELDRPVMSYFAGMTLGLLRRAVLDEMQGERRKPAERSSGP